MTTKIITVANQKGGVGKTTTAVNLAYCFAQKHETLLVDLDPQGQCSTLLGVDQEPGVFNVIVGNRPLKEQIRSTGRDRLAIFPGDKMTSIIPMVAYALKSPVSILKDILAPVIHNGTKYIVIDTNPSVSDLQAMALWAADFILIPTACDFASTEGLLKLLDSFDDMKAKYNWKGAPFGILPTFYDSQTNETRATMEYLKSKFDGVLFHPIHRATILRECMAIGRTVFEVAPRCRSVVDYADLANIVGRL